MSDSWEGKKLPNVTLKSTEGNEVHLPDDLLGAWTILYFYPKDDTPGCTKQACSYRDHLAQFLSSGAKVYGISLDSIESHKDFIQKYSLTFPLLSDSEHQLSEELGVYGEQSWKGKSFLGLSRDSFLIDPQGQVAKVWRKVDPVESVASTLEAIRSHK